jgi:hypothetical protein
MMKKEVKDRLVNEASELYQKIQKLALFLQSEDFKGLSNENQELLRKQYQLMLEYHQVLLQRIKIN